MSDFLNHLDQWALQVLMVIYHLFGIQDIPKVPDPHWQVVDRWVEQPDGHYRLVLESTTIQEECRSGRARYVVFPQTYMAKQEIYADNIRVYTNEMDKEWYLKSFLEKPIIDCNLIQKATLIKFIDLSYQKFFSTIGEWPLYFFEYPKNQFIYSISYGIVGFLAVFFSLIFFIIGYLFGEKNYHLLILGFGIFLVNYSHYSSFITFFPIQISHEFALFGIVLFVYVILYEKRINSLIFFGNIVLVIVLFIQLISSFGNKNLAQLYIILDCALSLLLIARHLFIEKDFAKRLMLIVVFIIGLKDFYFSQVLREGIFHLSLLCLVILFSISFRIIYNLYLKNMLLVKLNEKTENEYLIIEKMKEINFKMKQIVHDLKSPISSLNFIVREKDFPRDMVIFCLERMNTIINSSLMGDKDILTDFYSTTTLINCLDRIYKEKSNFFNSIKIHNGVSSEVLIFFNPEFVKTMFAELMDNSIKNNSLKKVNVVIILKNIENKFIEISYLDDGIGVDSSEISSLGVHGVSKFGSGLGLKNISETVLRYGGHFIIEKSEAGFFCKIRFSMKIM